MSIRTKGIGLAYLCYHLDRFSADIDLDLLDSTKEQELVAFLNSELPLLGTVKQMVIGHDLHRWKMSYDTQARNIKIELNKRQFTHTTYEIKNIDGMSVQCQTASSMVSNKLCALADRWYNRDLYDTHFFLKQGYIYNEDIIKDRTGMSLKVYIQQLTQEIPNNYDTHTILHQIGEVLDTNKQKTRVKNHLVDETIKLLHLYLETH